MSRPILLDLFCKAGGAATGYHRAGFEVVGVDLEDQPRYPFTFYRGDALKVAEWGAFSAVHASPPCQDHTEMRNASGVRHGTGWMLDATIDLLRGVGLPWVVENVPGASMPGAVVVCGRAMGIPELRRHRRFLSDVPLNVPPCGCAGAGQPIGVYGDLRLNDRNDNGRRRAGVATARRLLGCPWMTGPELSQAIPPAYTEHIGRQLMAHLNTTTGKDVNR